MMEQVRNLDMNFILLETSEYELGLIFTIWVPQTQINALIKM